MTLISGRPSSSPSVRSALGCLRARSTKRVESSASPTLPPRALHAASLVPQVGPSDLFDGVRDAAAVRARHDQDEFCQARLRAPEKSSDLFRDALVRPLVGLQQLVGGAIERDRGRTHRPRKMDQWPLDSCPGGRTDPSGPGRPQSVRPGSPGRWEAHRRGPAPQRRIHRRVVNSLSREQLALRARHRFLNERSHEGARDGPLRETERAWEHQSLDAGDDLAGVPGSRTVTSPGGGAGTRKEGGFGRTGPCANPSRDYLAGLRVR